MQREGHRLNAYLRTRSARTDTTNLIELSRPTSDGTTLLFAHPVGGSLLAYQPLVRRLGDHRCLGLEASPKTLAEDGSAESVQELARSYVAGFADDGPRIDVICGWSFGGALAWEIACLLAEQGVRPKVVLVDSTWPEAHHRDVTHAEVLRSFVHDALRMSGCAGETGNEVETEAEAAAVLGMDPETFGERFAIFARNRRLIAAWKPTPGDLDIVSVRAVESLKSDWTTVTSGHVHLQDLPGDHYGLFGTEANVAAIERAVRDDPPAAPAVVPQEQAEGAAGLHAALAALTETPHWRDLVIRSRRMDPDAIAEAYRELGTRGLLTPDWPAEFGGSGTPTRVAIELFEGFAASGLPDLVYALTVQIVGNFVLKSGSDRLKRELLPRISRGEEFATVLYSEPRAGSDLAALRTRAERRGDRYVLNGVKVFSIYSDIAGSALVAARTGQDGHKYDGITLFVIDLAAEGVSVELIDTLQREKMCRVRLKDVKVESWRRVGEEGRGWALLDGALAIERTGIDHVVRAARWLAALRGATGATVDLRRLEGQVECATTLARAAAEVFLRTDVKATDTAVAKLYTSETCQKVGHEVLRRWSTLGKASQASRVSGIDGLAYEELFSGLTESPGLTLSAGTSEMMLSTIGTDLREEAPRRCLEILHRFGGELVDTILEVLKAAGTGVKAKPLFAHSPARRDALEKTLADLGFDQVERPEEEGGLGLGLTVGCAISLSLGYLGYENAYGPCRLADPRTGTGDVDGAHDRCPAHACRLRHAAYVLGLGVGMFHTAWEYASTREQFGKKLVDADALMFPLIRSYAELTALGARLHEVAETLTDGDVDEGVVRRFELVEQDALVRVVRSAMQVLGAQGITEWSVASRFYMRCAESIGSLDHELDRQPDRGGGETDG
ncbi:Crotonobetainyl-CoA reductase [Streptomyces sp. enrichment culture]|uniref:acyl-CoA dehydrogenase family protein n=1 Tax=Streptomyces sp. enrichment culture TaxID=1795815 RepID=UPI003F5545BC